MSGISGVGPIYEARLSVCESDVTRLKKVIDGQDSGGISEAVDWKGGGGFRYFRLAPSLLEKDRFGNWIISKNYNAGMLAEALCKLEGFRYAPNPQGSGRPRFGERGYA